MELLENKKQSLEQLENDSRYAEMEEGLLLFVMLPVQQEANLKLLKSRLNSCLLGANGRWEHFTVKKEGPKQYCRMRKKKGRRTRQLVKGVVFLTKRNWSWSSVAVTLVFMVY